MDMHSHWVFDLDGTLLDVEARYRRIHADLVTARGGRPDPGYWMHKREKTAETAIAMACGLSEEHAEGYAQDRLLVLEQDRYLAHDRLFPGALEVLRAVGPGNALLATKRRDRAALDRQLERLGLRDRFARVMTPAAGADKSTLHPAIRDWWRSAGRIVSVTDSPQDITDGKASGFVTIAVLSGLRSRRFIEAAEPDSIIAAIGELTLEKIEHVSAN